MMLQNEFIDERGRGRPKMGPQALRRRPRAEARKASVCGGATPIFDRPAPTLTARTGVILI